MSRINQILIPIIFFIQYLGIGALAQGIILLLFFIEFFRGKRLAISLIDTILLFSVLLLFITKLFYVELLSNILMIKFYWGFIIFYFYFKLIHYKINLLLFFWLAVIITTIDCVLINTIIPLEMMKNIPKAHALIISLEPNFSFFYRCYGLASIPTASATIIVALLAGLYTQQRYDFKNYHMIVAIIPLLCLGSGMGFLLFLFFVLVRFKLFRRFKFIFGFSGAILFYNFVKSHEIEEGGIFARLSMNYFVRLFDLKMEQITNELILLKHSLFETLIGLNYHDIAQVRLLSDFGWIDMLECYGFIGVIIFLLFLVLKKKLIYLPILIFILGFIHYPALGSIPGQILFATLLMHSPNDKNELELSHLKITPYFNNEESAFI